MAKRPGVMLFFDMRPALKRLSLDERGRILDAILDYAADGVEPDFSDSVALAITWDFLRPGVDRDESRYDQAVLQRKYAGYRSVSKRKGIQPLEYEEWLDISNGGTESPSTVINEKQRPFNAVDGCQPTTTTTPSTTPSSTPSTPATGGVGGERAKTLEMEFEDRRRAAILHFAQAAK